MSGLLDPGALTRLAEAVDAEFAWELVDLYLSQLDQSVSAVVAGLPESDPEAWLRTAHSLKSSSLQVGAVALAALCRRIETDEDLASTEAAAEFIALVKETRNAFEAQRGEILGG